MVWLRLEPDFDRIEWILDELADDACYRAKHYVMKSLGGNGQFLGW
jgi:hypothetical protein